MSSAVSVPMCDGVDTWPNAWRHGPDAPFPWATTRVTYKVSGDKAALCGGCFDQEYGRGRLDGWERIR